MKCDELKDMWFNAYPEIMGIEGGEPTKCYGKAEVDEAIAELKDENRRLKRALWMARAEKARFLAMVIDNCPYTQVLHFTSRKRDESGKPLGVARTAMEWWNMFKEVERKCLAKAKEYK